MELGERVGGVRDQEPGGVPPCPLLDQRRPGAMVSVVEVAELVCEKGAGLRVGEVSEQPDRAGGVSVIPDDDDPCA